MSEVREALEGLTPEQRARLAARLRERRRATAEQDVIGPRPDQAQHPLSPAQERIWALSRLRPDDPVYNVHTASRLRGPLDADALREAFGQVVRRHETLRATFVDVSGRAEQRITPPGTTDFEVVEVDDDDLTATRRLARCEAEQPFDLETGPLLRIRLLQLGGDDHVLLVTAHHIVCDGWSMGVIEREVSAAYRALTTGRSVELDETPLQFADIAHWQRQRTAVVQGQTDYWSEHLGTDVERLRLPGDGDGRVRVGSTAGAHRTFEVPAPLTSAVRELSRRVKVTPFTTLVAAFQLMLSRWTGQKDLVVCTPVAGRTRRETQDVVGFFNNLVVIRGDLSQDPTVVEVLQRMRSTIGEAFDHQEVPFQTIAALPHLARTRLTRALFVLQDGANTGLELPDVESVGLVVEAATADFDLGVFVRPDGDRLVGAVRYRTDQFDDSTITDVLDSLTVVLQQVVAAPEQRVSQLPTFGTEPADARDVAADDRTLAHPRTALESGIRDIWQQLFAIAPISIHDDFFELGGHSLLAAEIAAEIEQRITGRPLPLASLFTAPTIAALAALIERDDWHGAWSSLVPIKPTGERPPLFFVHAHGGNVIGYSDLARNLPAAQPFYGLQAPAMDETRAVEARSIPDIARHYLSEVRSVAPDGPYFFGGWCLGADVAYEMAVQARAQGADVPLVLMVDNPRPAHIATGRAGPPLSRLRNRIRTRLTMEWENVRELRGRERWRHLVARTHHVAVFAAVRVEGRVATALDGTSIRLPESRAYRLEKIAVAHEKAYQAYDPPSYDGDVALFRAAQQPAGRADDRSLGWAPHVVGTLAILDVPGHRIGLLSEPRVGAVAKRMVDVMDCALAPSHGTP